MFALDLHFCDYNNLELSLSPIDFECQKSVSENIFTPLAIKGGKLYLCNYLGTSWYSLTLSLLVAYTLALVSSSRFLRTSGSRL